MTMNRNLQPPPDWQDDRQLWELLGRAGEIEPSVGFTDRTLRRLHAAPACDSVRRVWRWALAGGLAVGCLVALVTYREAQLRHQAGLYIEVQQADYFEDFDVIAALHWIEGDPQP